MEHRTSRYRLALACICLVLFLAGRPLAAAEKLLFDFKDGAALKAWSQFLPDNLKVPGAKEPPVKIELSGENAASGKRCLKLTFSGGKYPTVATHSPLEDWTVYNSFKADVTASRTCLVAFRVVREDDKEHRGWVKLALLHQGRNAVVDVAPTPRGLDNGRPLKGPTQFEIIVYAPREGEAIFVDNLRVSTEVPDTATPPHGEHVTPGDKARFYPKLGKIPVLGLGIEVQSAGEFGKQMMEHWVRPADKTVEQVEAEFRACTTG